MRIWEATWVMFALGCVARAPLRESADGSDGSDATTDAAGFDDVEPSTLRRVKALEILSKWNDAMSGHDVASLEAMYASRVNYYTARFTPLECAQRIRELFVRWPTFTQTVRDSEVWLDPNGNAALVRFAKKTVGGASTKEYDAYLVLDFDFKITEEGDVETDEGRGVPPIAVRAGTSSRTCADALGQIDDWMDRQHPIYAEHRAGPSRYPSTRADPTDEKYGVCSAAWSFVPGGFAHRQYAYCVDLRTGVTVGTGGWMMLGAEETPLPVPDGLGGDVARLCKQRVARLR
jgi:hypothetical protein